MDGQRSAPDYFAAAAGMCRIAGALYIAAAHTVAADSHIVKIATVEMLPSLWAHRRHCMMFVRMQRARRNCHNRTSVPREYPCKVEVPRPRIGLGTRRFSVYCSTN